MERVLNLGSKELENLSGKIRDSINDAINQDQQSRAIVPPTYKGPLFQINFNNVGDYMRTAKSKNEFLILIPV